MRKSAMAGLAFAAAAIVLLAAAAVLLDEGRPAIPPPKADPEPAPTRAAIPAPSVPLAPPDEVPATKSPVPTLTLKPGPPKPSRPEELLLRVVDHANGARASGVQVVATPLGTSPDPDAPAQPVVGTTDANGYVRLALDPLAGGYLLRVTGEGRAPAELEIRRRPGQEFGKAEIRIAAAGSVSGRVLDPEGRPVPSATVFVDGTTGIFHLDRERIAGPLGVFPDVATLSARLPTVVTGKDGGFRMEGVPVGQVLVVFAAAPGLSPSAPDMEFKVPAEEKTARLDLGLRSDSSVSVRFLDGEENPTGEPVQAWISTRRGYVPLTPNSAGVQEASGLDPGPQDLVYVPAMSAFDRKPLEVPEGRRLDFEVTLAEGKRLEGRVENDARLGIANIKVEARGSIPGVVAALPLRAALTDHEGNFVLTGLSWNDVILGVRGPATGFLFEQGAFKQETRARPVRLVVPAAVRARFLPPGGLPFAPKTVLWTWACPTRRDVHMRPLDEPGNVSFNPRTGEFQVRELPAGACTLRVVVSGFAHMTRPLELPSGETTDLGEIPIAAGHAVEGSVHAPDGRGQPGIRVRAWYANGESPVTYSGPDGRYRFLSLRPGMVTLEFHDVASRETRFALETRPLVVEAGATAPRVDLQEGGVVIVRVRREDGKSPRCTLVGCVPAGLSYRPDAEPLVPWSDDNHRYVGRRPPGPAEVTLYDPRGYVAAAATVQVERGRTEIVDLIER